MNKKKFLLFLITFLAVFLRFYRLGISPSGLHGDEAAFGYNAYSILKTGADEYGKKMPLVLQSFDDYKPAFYAYLVIPLIAIFGLNAFSVRFVSALFGSLTVLLTYFLCRELFSKRYSCFMGIIACFLLAISPWHLNLSRTASEVVVSIFFILLNLYSLINLLKKWSKKWVFLAILCSLFSVFSYTASRFFIVLIPTVFLILNCSLIKSNKVSIRFFMLLFLFFTLSIGYSFMASINRFTQISIFHNPGTKLVLEEQIREDQFTPILITRVFHNKAINYFRTIFKNYAEYLNLKFLFLDSGMPERMVVPSTGLFYIWQIPFLLLGLFFIFKEQERNGIFLIFWWLTTLIPISLTFHEVPNVYRSLIIVFPMILIISFGIIKYWTAAKDLIAWKKKTFLIYGFGILIVLLAVVWEFFYYEHQYFVHQRLHQPWHRQYGYEELVNEIKILKNDYQHFIITKSEKTPYIFFLFYQKYDPYLYQNFGSPRDYDYSGFDKYLFVPEDCPSQKQANFAGGRNIVIDWGNCQKPPYAKILKTIYREDQTPVFHLIEIDPESVAS